MLTGHKGLAMTSSTPGKTLLINHFIIDKKWYLVDLPGYGYAKRNQKMQGKISDIIRNYILRRDQLTSLFVLIDSRLSPQKIDMEFITWLGENGVPFGIIFTKVDKLSKAKVNSNVETVLNVLRESWEELPPYFLSFSNTSQFYLTSQNLRNAISRNTSRKHSMEYTRCIPGSLRSSLKKPASSSLNPIFMLRSIRFLHTILETYSAIPSAKKRSETGVSVQ